MLDNTKTCVIIGASHAGVNCAFALRKEKWEDAQDEHSPLKSETSYEKADIALRLNTEVTSVNVKEQKVIIENGEEIGYDQLIFATGARAFMPPIKGLKVCPNAFALRTAQDAINIRKYIEDNQPKNVVIIGGGYIGLETAASLTKLGLQVSVIERENRILARVTSPEMSDFFRQLHVANGVHIHEGQTVSSISSDNGKTVVICNDNTKHKADLIIIGTGISVNLEIAKAAGVLIDQGIKVDKHCKTNVSRIYAIGDCTNHPSTFYNRDVRLESVQNAVDQAKVAAANICEREISNDAIPWFWSDQYDLKLQMVGLQQGYNEVITRTTASEDGNYKFSMWYFLNDQLLAVDAVNDSKAYVYGTKYIKSRSIINKQLLSDASIELKSILKED